MEHLIKIFSKEGSLVVDPFIGSGTTAIGAVDLRRLLKIDKSNISIHSITSSSLKRNYPIF